MKQYVDQHPMKRSFVEGDLVYLRFHPFLRVTRTLDAAK